MTRMVSEDIYEAGFAAGAGDLTETSATEATLDRHSENIPRLADAAGALARNVAPASSPAARW